MHGVSRAVGLRRISTIPILKSLNVSDEEMKKELGQDTTRSNSPQKRLAEADIRKALHRKCTGGKCVLPLQKVLKRSAVHF